MKINFTFFLLPCLLLFLYACQPEEGPIVCETVMTGEQEMEGDTICQESYNLYNCEIERTWEDSAEIAYHMVAAGEWKLEYDFCFRTWGQCRLSEKRTIRFYSDSSLGIMENGELVSVANWEIIVETTTSGKPRFRIKTSPSDKNMRGAIIICDNWIGFFNSPTDGCDSYYKKVD